VGDRVGAGSIVSIIGTVGQSGNANGQPASEAHVHFEIRKNGNIVEGGPEKFLNSLCPKDFPGRIAGRSLID
jgi:murein DD-endopeptidase MepM/ murein hydrolase activator NlpD